MNDEPVSWKYYLATGITAMITCFLSAVQGNAGVFYRVREILIMILRTDVHPLWVFIPAFLVGVAACWVERPKNSRSVLIAGLASFSLFGFAPYSKGSVDLEGRSKNAISGNNLLLYLQGFEYDARDLSIIVRDSEFQIYQRIPHVQEEMALRVPQPGSYWVEVNGGTHYRNKIYPVTMEDEVVALEIVLEKVSGWEGFLQKFQQAVRVDRPASD